MRLPLDITTLPMDLMAQHKAAVRASIRCPSTSWRSGRANQGRTACHGGQQHAQLPVQNITDTNNQRLSYRQFVQGFGKTAAAMRRRAKAELNQAERATAANVGVPAI
jgi:hypothetical protein